MVCVYKNFLQDCRFQCSWIEGLALKQESLKCNDLPSAC